MDSPLLKTAEQAIEWALNRGASDAWASIGWSHGVNFEMRNGILEKVEDSTSRGLSIRLWVDGRFSVHSTNDLRPASMEVFVAEAVAVTRALQADPFRVIPDPALFAGRSEQDLDLVDRSIAEVTREQRLEMLHTMNGRILGQDKVLSTTTAVSTSQGEAAAMSSNGFQGTYQSTRVSVYADVVLDDDEKRPEEAFFGGGRHQDELPSLEEVADQALQLARQRLGSKKGPTKKTTMVVDPRAASPIVGRLLGALDGGSLQQGRSFWAGKLGQQVVSPLLTIWDNPLVVRGLASRPFDGEGIAAKSIPVLEAGVLRNYYIDTYYGRKLGMTPTTGSPSNRILSLGEKDREALIGDLEEGILITSWLGGNSDSATGDFSLGVRGHLIEAGKVGAPVSEMNVTGNLLTLFGSLRAIGNDPWKFSALKAPTLVFENVNFSGA
jgi:PmbA protein